MTFFHQKGTGRNFLTSYVRSISCLKCLFLFIMMNAQLLSFVAGGVWDPKNAGYCTKLPTLWQGETRLFHFLSYPLFPSVDTQVVLRKCFLKNEPLLN